MTEEDLQVLFGRYGDIVYTKIPPGKGCGFVQFVQRPAAEAAMGQMQVGLEIMCHMAESLSHPVLAETLAILALAASAARILVIRAVPSVMLR